MSIAFDMLKYLELKGLGVEGINLFLGFEPESPDNCITIYDESASTIPESACLSVDSLGIQITVRNNNYALAEQISRSIHKRIVGFGGAALVPGGEIVSYLTVETAPNSLGKDIKGRNQWSAHYVVRAESSDDDFRL